MIRITRLTDISSEPVAIADIKTALGIVTSSHDTLLTQLQKVARMEVEEYCRTSLGSSTWRITLDCFRTDLVIPIGPVITVDSVKYYDDDGALQTLATSKYKTSIEGRHALIRFNDIPTVDDEQPGAVQINITAGHSTVPEPLKQAIYLLVGHYYENPAEEVAGTITTILKHGTLRLMAPYRVLT